MVFALATFLCKASFLTIWLLNLFSTQFAHGRFPSLFPLLLILDLLLFWFENYVVNSFKQDVKLLLVIEGSQELIHVNSE